MKACQAKQLILLHLQHTVMVTEGKIIKIGNQWLEPHMLCTFKKGNRP